MYNRYNTTPSFGPPPYPTNYRQAPIQPVAPQQPFPYMSQQMSGFPPNVHQPAQKVAEVEEKPPIMEGPYVQFAKPPQPNQWNPYYSLQQQFPQYGQNPQKGLAQYFQDKNGQLDLDKMLSTMGQVANTANQFSPLVKSLSSLFIGGK